MGCENPAELLCNAEFLTALGEVKTLTGELLQDLGMTAEELLQLYTAMGETTDVQMEIPAQEQTGEEQQNQAGQQAVKDAAVLVAREATDTSSVSTETEQQRTMSTNDQSLMGDAEVQQIGEQETWKEAASGGKQADAQNQGKSSESCGSAGTGTYGCGGNPRTGTSAKPVSQLDAFDMIRQITEFTKVTVKAAQTTMEMQLNPEHLGKLYIEVTTKEGNVSAHILTRMNW